MARGNEFEGFGWIGSEEKFCILDWKVFKKYVTSRLVLIIYQVMFQEYILHIGLYI